MYVKKFVVSCDDEKTGHTEKLVCVSITSPIKTILFSFNYFSELSRTSLVGNRGNYCHYITKILEYREQNS